MVGQRRRYLAAFVVVAAVGAPTGFAIAQAGGDSVSEPGTVNQPDPAAIEIVDADCKALGIADPGVQECLKIKGGPEATSQQGVSQVEMEATCRALPASISEGNAVCDELVRGIPGPLSAGQ